MRDEAVWLVRGLVALAPYLPVSVAPELGEELLDAALSLAPTSRPVELAQAAPYLTEPLLRRALETFAGSDDGSVAARRALLPRLAELGHASEAFEDALATQLSGRVRDRYPGVDAWACLVPHLPESMKVNACDKGLGLISRVDAPKTTSGAGSGTAASNSSDTSTDAATGSTAGAGSSAGQTLVDVPQCTGSRELAGAADAILDGGDP